MLGRKVLLAAIVFFTMLELLLQTGAVFASSTLAASTSNGPSVLCLGDSYTAGVGATSPEQCYPAQLQRQLRLLGHRDITVVNGGCPGKDSAFMMRRLPGLLSPETKVLCLLMAFNDTWSQPDLIDAEQLDLETSYESTFEWQWRTGRLMALCLGFGDNSWHRTSDQLAATDPAATVISEHSLQATEAGFALLQKVGIINLNDPAPSITSVPPAALQGRINKIEKQLFADKRQAALADVVQLVADFPESASAYRTLAIIANTPDQLEQSKAALAKLAAMAAAGDPTSNENQIIALLATGNNELALSAAKAYLKLDPRSLTASMAAQAAAHILGLFNEFCQEAPRTLRLAGQRMPLQSAAIARHYAEVIHHDDAQKAGQLIVAATLLDGNRALTRARVSAVRQTMTWDHFDQAIDTAPVADEAQRKALRLVLRTAFEDDGSSAPWAATMRQHMLGIGRLCAERGIELVILDYPFPHPELERIQHEVADDLSATLVSVRAHFDQELETRKKTELFVRNGHCNDTGYSIMAELTATAISPLLR